MYNKREREIEKEILQLLIIRIVKLMAPHVAHVSSKSGVLRSTELNIRWSMGISCKSNDQPMCTSRGVWS